MDGIINVYKEAGFTSHDVVAKLRGILKQKKIGHTGTLDPEAEGVLPVCLGNATKLCDMLTEKRKEYIAEFLCGVVTDTQDMTGTVLSRSKADLTEEAVRTVIMSFLGESDQIPPMYSACKVNGRRLYELAREGKEVERKARRITIYELEILGMELPNVTIRVLCSKGTYIRTLCHDIGQKLGCGAAMQSLLRTRVERFTLADARRLDEIKEFWEKDEIVRILLPVDAMFETLPAITVMPFSLTALQNGNPLYLRQIKGKSGWMDGEWARVYDEAGKFYGIYAFFAMKGRFQPVKMFLEG